MSSDAPSACDADDGPRPFSGHTEKITAIEYSPDGRLIATASKDATVRLWDPSTGEQLQKLETTYQAEGLAFHPSSRQLATICVASANIATVLVWEVREDRSGVTQNTAIKTTYEASTHAHFIRFSNNGKLLAVMSSSFITLQDAETGQLVMDVTRLGPLHELIRLLAFASNDQSILFAHYYLPISGTGEDATYSDTPVFYSFDLETRQQKPIILSFDPLHRLLPRVISYDGAMIAGSAPHGAYIWEANSGEVLCGPLKGHVSGTNILCFSRDGERLIHVSMANNVFIWDTSTGSLVLGPLEQPPNLGIATAYDITAATCSPLKDRVACADVSGNIHVWDVDTEQVVLSSLPDRKQVQPLVTPGRFEVDSVHWFPDGRHFISSSKCDDYISTTSAHGTPKQESKFGSTYSLAAHALLYPPMAHCWQLAPRAASDPS
ncbi:WD40 repeat-like protein [Coniophora puteana RWD-64-598 SS2]|uniref:WD40 repeat-like protein n=1 Tax=Coniophora puteana (strain RWD-64-598) TaxID=741705 RepID=A0A5M3MF05_CONPW|nr:WD40 repeat-like protein [Coniophora puteana RWD-64-598 SS2]EIW77374.1 WD40 repeat-like protein [Coniophora puteana RWD-64-598 SS2]